MFVQLSMFCHKEMDVQNVLLSSLTCSMSSVVIFVAAGVVFSNVTYFNAVEE